jgi:hypothetical protein
MGRHARLADREALFEAFEDTAERTQQGQEGLMPEAAQRRRFRWISRVPLLPTIAGVGAVGVVLAAYGTQQISLNFTDGIGPPRAEDQARPKAAQPGAAAQGARSGGAPGHGGGVTVSFRATSKWADGFEGSATIANVGGRAINGWMFAFRIPNARVVSIWDVQVVRPGSTVVVRNPSQSPTIAPGEIVRIGFTANGAAASPSACTFNGMRCHIV